MRYDDHKRREAAEKLAALPWEQQPFALREIADDLCSMHLTDGFCGRQSKGPDCQCARLARTIWMRLLRPHASQIFIGNRLIHTAGHNADAEIVLEAMLTAKPGDKAKATNGPIDWTEVPTLEDAARDFKQYAFSPPSQPLDGFIGIGADNIQVYFHRVEIPSDCNRPKAWRGFEVIYHFGVGRIIAS